MTSVTSGSLVAALVATAAVLSNGYTAQRLDLNDASVWVASGTRQAVARANTEVRTFDTVVETTGSDLEVVQAGTRVLVLDRGAAKADVLDPATAQVVETVSLPPGRPTLALAGDNVVVHEEDTGRLWLVPFAQFPSFDPDAEPDLSLGVGALVSVDPVGAMFTFSPSVGTVSRVDAGTASAVESSTAVDLGEEGDEFQLTSVGGRWALLNLTSGTLQLEGSSHDLADALPDGQAELQLPSSDPGNVLLAHPAGLLSVPFDGSAPTELSSGLTGTPARPAVVDGCAFSAWSGGDLWRQCGGDDGPGEELRLDGVSAGAQLVFRANGSRAVLNDSRGGSTWAVQSSAELIDNWEQLIRQEETDEQAEENDPDNPPEVDKLQEPPVAVDDELGARPGRTSVLPVLLNDYDSNGDVLVISDVEPLPVSVGRVEVINDNQQLQITLDSDAEGELKFAYSISDGRGGAATATVRVTVRGGDVNGPPRQVRQTRTVVESGGVVSTQVLGDWVDPDGDPMYLANAAVAEPDSAAYEPGGEVVYTDAGSGAGPRTVALTVSDLRSSANGRLTVTVSDAGDVPIVPDAFVVLAYAGQEVRIDPLPHVRGGTGALRLTSVPAKTGATITPSYEKGTFRFRSDEVRTHYLEYVVSDDERSATGLVRVEVLSPPEANLTPITVPKTVFVRSLASETVEVAETDIDPAGGVLSVTGVRDIPPSAAVRAEILEQSAVRVTLSAPLDEPLTFGYRVSNGLAEADGTITVIEIPRPERVQPPIARDDSVTVRVGDAIDIPVLANDEHPDNEAIRLVPELVSSVPDGGGLLFASGSRLRYLAPERTGIYTAVYSIEGPGGETAQAEVRITVNEVNEAANTPPVPRGVTARVLAGERVLIDVPLNGVDPDGDSVQLLGQATNPEKGAVVSVAGNVIEYEAGSYSAGTDSFTYTVVDGLGARATGTVRVGIMPRIEGTRNPVAIEDEVHVRPDRTVAVQVLANDSDPDGGALRVTSVETGDDESQTEIIDDAVVRVTPPTKPGRYGYVYSIENESGGTSSNFLTVVVDPDAPLAYPLAADTVLTLSDVLDRQSVDVDVLRNVFFAEGDSSELGLSVLPGYGTAEVTADRRIRVQIGERSQVIPFAVSHPENEDVRSYAFIWVPGLEDAIPQLDRTAEPLVVTSEETLTIELNDHVLAVAGKRVRLTDSSTVQATHSNGQDLVVDEDTLRFTSAARYFGPASISFQVTDGASANDPEARTATLVLPIQVEPRNNQPPQFLGGVIDFEPTQEIEVDLVKLTNYPYADDVDELEFRVLAPSPEGFSYDLDGQILTLRADEDAEKGSRTGISLSVRDAQAAGAGGRIELRVVPSTRPLARPAPDQALVRRGSAETVDVLANDEATNPFPGAGLRVVAIRGLDGASLPAGIEVEPSSDDRRLSVRVDEDAEPGDAHLQYQVEDATGDPDRRVWGSVTISVQDVPDAPVAAERQGGFVGGELSLRITPPNSNNSAITNYRVTSTTGGAEYSYDCGLQTICRLEGLEVAKQYTFRIVAENGIGESAPGAPSAPLSVDYLPDAPGNVQGQPIADDPAGGALRITWTPSQVPSGGSPVVDYVVAINGSVVATVAPETTGINTASRGIPLQPNTVAEISVHARNSAQAGESAWLRSGASVRTVGPPGAPSPAPSAVVEGSGGDIRVSWGTSDPNGAGSVTYAVARVDTAGSVPTSCSGAEGSRVSPQGVSSGWLDTDTRDGRNYVYLVIADNGLFCRVFASGSVEAKRPPGEASGTASIAYSDSGQYDIFANGNVTASGIVAKYQYRLSTDGTWRDLPGSRQLTSLADSSVYGQSITVQFRACRDSSTAFCGEPSRAGDPLTPVNTRVAATSCIPDERPQITAPRSGASLSYSYRVAYRVGSGGWSDYDEYSPANPVPSDAVGIRVKARVTIGSETYEDRGYGEFACR
ncbi:Ig-like domain-containing protein [Lysobacter korlensis]|uniref:Ig-like domain-containing protein n=1 Tax=Lysobacter korlensis TaxID=553636 RepID=A0ABV6S1A4_9GAMM